MTAAMLFNLNVSTLSATALVCMLVCLIVKLFETSPVPKNIPWVLSRKGFLQRAAERFIGVNPIGFIQEGYEKYSKNKQPFVMPSVNEGDEVILPKEFSNTVLFAKESEYSFKAHIVDFFQLKYTSWPLAFAEKYDFFVKLVSKDLTETLKSKCVATSLADEARSCLTDIWGEDTENWVEVPLYSTMEKAAARMINVLAIGPGESHDTGLLNAMTNCSNAIVFGANVIKAFPSFLHPIVGPVVGLVNRYQEHAFHTRMKPIIDAKIKEQKEAYDSEKLKEHLKTKGSLLDLLIQAGLRSKWPVELDTMWLAYRMFMINFPGVHTSGISASSALLDILSYPNDEGFGDMLQDEINKIAAGSDGSWTAAELEQATLLESAIKESLRFNGINLLSPTRKVVAPEGATLPDGTFLPYGTKIGIPQYAIHRDSDLYPNPNEYNPYRFYKEHATADELRQNSMTNTSDTYLVFGHGRRQCPGRWVFAHIFKLLIAEIFLKYEIKPLATRPKIHRWGRFQLPPLTVKLTIRRKKDTVAVFK
ncbi:cytochrome P450 [Aspergillus clavatus NRRL 1]|uniref:Cytochrome P450, putative n=1 Tax=Aspergillus clavatus (strain ATCC 1007 / CBS 513.65 / DSM 816 / NCTC 3887 / NRRL 1 / QM 1276 / 107) TaxID=344612 RepID=A1C8W1_ASPCL|nr:cytochrome P450, putative [Aspergillus clavatus NRRL 1]EAW13748.1 cytochrome P450, putative [Aspergillus clavatus NRRL 1]